MSNNPYTTQLRALLCPSCGAPVTTPPQGPVIFGILKANAKLGLCQRTCARLGIQIPS